MGGDAEGMNEVWVLNWVKEMMEIGCFQRHGREEGRARTVFSLKGRRKRKKGNNFHFLPRSPHL